MNKQISKAALEARRAKYKNGARVELVSMSDPYTKLKAGDLGTVDFVDDTGTVFIIWDSGAHLGAVYGADEIRLLPAPISDTVKEQILAIRATGKTNMFDTPTPFNGSLSTAATTNWWTLSKPTARHTLLLY
jgi:hypothetical protein